MQKRKIVSAGHICLDITPSFLHEAHEGISTLLAPGQLVQMGAADIHTGGSVANTGRALRFFGADAVLMGKIGDDSFGEILLTSLQEEGAGMLVAKGEATSYSVVLAPPGLDRIFLHHTGANDTFGEDDPDYGIIAQACLFHFGYPPLMQEMLANGGAALISMFKRVKALGVATSLDMAAIDANAPAGKADWDAILQGLLPHVDFFLPSIEELLFMLDRPALSALIKRADGQDITDVLAIEENVVPLAEKALAYGAKVVMVKCGARGLYLAVSGTAGLHEIGGGLGMDMSGWGGIRHFEASFVPDAVVSATGAGDTCIAAFLHAATQNRPWRDCVRLAAAAGACCVTAYDALSGLLSFEEMQVKIDAGWKQRLE